MKRLIHVCICDFFRKKKAKPGPKPRDISDLGTQAFNSRTNDLVDTILKLLDEKENQGMDFLTLWAKVGRRISWDSSSRLV